MKEGDDYKVSCVCIPRRRGGAGNKKSPMVLDGVAAAVVAGVLVNIVMLLGDMLLECKGTSYLAGD